MSKVKVSRAKAGGSKRHIHQQARCAMLPCLGYLESECEDCVNYNLYRKTYRPTPVAEPLCEIGAESDMNIVGAKKCYDGEWWDDMMKLPKPFLIAALERANRRADKAEESAPTSHNSQRLTIHKHVLQPFAVR
jgi:hypothetical protein